MRRLRSLASAGSVEEQSAETTTGAVSHFAGLLADHLERSRIREADYFVRNDDCLGGRVCIPLGGQACLSGELPISAQIARRQF